MMTMKPGPELDNLVALAMGWKRANVDQMAWETPGGLVTRDLTSFGEFAPSEDWRAAGQAWEWLQKEVETNPPEGWEQVDGQVYLLALADYDGPAVMLVQDTDFGMPLYWEREPEYPYNWYIPGETYPHAIALAVVEAAKAKVPDKAA